MINDILNSIWPEWQIVRRINNGSYGIVYEVIRTDHAVKSSAAIKVISIPQDESEIESLRSIGLSENETKTYLQEVVNDFVNEIQLMQSFKGIQNIVSVEDYRVIEKKDNAGWIVFIRMELLTPLVSHICDKTLSEQEVIKLGCDICSALERCEKRNVIHRDIKPDNIFINEFGDYKLGDFGIARTLENVTGGLSQKGTYNYMAPEVVKGMQYDAAVDIYSLGIVLYWLMNKKRLPFLSVTQQLIGPNDLKLANHRRLNGEPLPYPCDASASMAKVILCACAADPNERFSSATEMKTALTSISNGTFNGNGFDKTWAVRKASKTNISTTKSVDTFGTKKKSKTPSIFATVLAVLFLICGGMYIAPRLPGNNNSQTSSSVNRSATVAAESSDSSGTSEASKNDIYSDFDNKQISATIEAAEALAADENYEGALTKIKTALVTYPKSESLKAKENEYANALAIQVKEKTLEEAASYAETGDYTSAIALIKNAQKVNGEDEDYTDAYNKYCVSYKSEVLGTADDLSNHGDHLGALKKVSEATAVIGEDSELTAKSQEYEDAYVSGVIAQAEELLATKDYDGADELVNAAKKEFRNNSALANESQKIASARPVGSKDIMQILSASVLSNSGGYKAYIGSDYINAFAEDQYNAFSINTAVSYNIWGNNIQNVSFKISDFTFDTLSFTICGETGTSGSVTIDLYLDRPVEDGAPDYSFNLDDAPYPLNAVIDVSDKTTLAFRVTNHAGNENRIVFYNFEGT